MTRHTPVLIIGAGPTGLCASIFLARHGVQSLLIERHPGTSIHPKATGISVRTMEILRNWGIEPAIRAAGMALIPVSSIRHTLASPEIGNAPLAVFEPEHLLSPADVALCSQDLLEPILLGYAKSYTAAEIRFGVDVTEIVQDADGVTATLKDRSTGHESTVRALYMIAADGAGSPTRSRLKIRMIGVEHVNRFISVLFRADLSAYTSRGAGLYRIEHPAIKGVIVPMSSDGRWVLGMPWSGADNPLETVGAAELTQMIRTAVGDAELQPDIIGAQTFDISALVADRFRDGRVFLAGDAAHRMTPSGALGMNSAIHDAHNLAWKLAAVLQGWANPTLLDTYNAERRPVAERNVTFSLGLRRDISHPMADLGSAYTSAAVIPDGPFLASVMSDLTMPAWPGCRTPHVPVEQDGEAISTVDLPKERFVLLASDHAAGGLWAACGWSAAREFGVPFVAYRVGRQGDLVETRGKFTTAFGIDKEGAVLIRPDGHIAWRSTGAVANPLAEMVQVFSRVLGSHLVAEAAVPVPDRTPAPQHVGSRR